MALRLCALCLFLLTLAPGLALASPAPFDLAGPALEVTVTHGGVSLPIAQTPNLAAGDHLRIRADLPKAQSVHYLLVAAFLRGATNPPPLAWFFKSETWGSKAGAGLEITVPQGAQQVLVFLAPQTGGDFKTLTDAVRGRPGAFVRASQDLNQATLDRSRLDAFLAAISKVGPADTDHLKTVSPLLARSLAIKLNADCLVKAPELQASCLMQGQDSLVLNDGHSTSIVQALASGNSADLIAALSSTPQAGFGYYSPYIGAVMDIARILDSLHTARYQYIPALGIEKDGQLSLLLNTPPSFQDPKSVLVAALPAIEAPQIPPLQPVDADAVYCLGRPGLTLPVEGAPLVFSTAYAHGMVLRLKGANGQSVDAPVSADAEKGGLVVDARPVEAAGLGGALEGVLHGEWGFTPFDGPRFDLQAAQPNRWELDADDKQSLVVGRDDVLHLKAGSADCVESVAVRPSSGDAVPVDWKHAGPDRLTVTVPLKAAQPGPLTLLIRHYGLKDPDEVALQAYAEAGRLDGFSLFVGEGAGVLKGARLDQVTGLTLRGVAFKPGELTSAAGADQLSMAAADAAPLVPLKPGDSLTAKVALKDGRTIGVKALVEPSRPKIALISRTVQPDAPNAHGMIQLAGKDEVPLGATVTFSVHAQAPASFSGKESLEVANAAGVVLATLSLANGLVLEDAGVAVASLDTGKAFNTSTFGPLQFRVVVDGAAGDWQHLATLVRLPALGRLKCAAGASQACELSGANLFLIDSLSGDARFDRPVKVPEGFTGYSLKVPHPSGGRLYLRLRDDPSVVDTITVAD